MVFYWRARKIKEITWLPKFIMLLSNIEGIAMSSYYVSIVFFNKWPSTALGLFMHIFPTVTTPIIMGQLIRFQRVQVQLRAQEENIINILNTIKRANIFEVVLVLTLIISWLC